MQWVGAGHFYCNNVATVVITDPRAAWNCLEPVSKSMNGCDVTLRCPIAVRYQDICDWISPLKGEVSPNTHMWIGWVESNFINQTVKVWADLDNPFKQTVIMQSCVCRPLWIELCQNMCNASQEDNSPLTLYIDFHHLFFFLGYQVLLIKLH